MKSWRSVAAGDFHRELGRTPGTALVMVGASACSACRLARQRVPAWSEGAVDDLIYLDAEVSTAVVRELGVFHLPAFFLYRDGEFHAAMSAELTANAWRAALDRRLAAAPEEAP